MRPIRILHVLRAMNRGGVETWLMHVLRHVDRNRFQMDFLVHTDEPAAYDDEVLALGSSILCCPEPHNPLVFGKHFLEIAERHGPFDVVHSHVHHFSGYVLALARTAGIPLRIAHSHNDTSADGSRSGLARRSYLNVMQLLIHANCTHGIGVSEPAARDLFGARWRANKRYRVLYCGIDLAPFRSQADSVAARAEFGFSPNDVIFGHVGRFCPQKNHIFLLEVAAGILRQEPRAKFLLVGDGPLRAEMQKRACVLGLTDKIAFAGLRPDVSRLLMGAMDVFLFPSVHEGLPIVLMETQAAGLRSVVSEGVPEEAIINSALVQRVPLSAGVREWTRVACDMAGQSHFGVQRALEIFDTSPFTITRSAQDLSDIYLEAWSG
jgi:glycosyltransferase involved in cell wall biosynthesis